MASSDTAKTYLVWLAPLGQLATRVWTGSSSPGASHPKGYVVKPSITVLFDCAVVCIVLATCRISTCLLCLFQWN